MKNVFYLIVIVIFLMSVGCAAPGHYNTQKGAAAGAAVGAIAGQVIGGNTAGTLLGAGIGTGIGAILGNAFDQQRQLQNDSYYESKNVGQSTLNYSNSGQISECNSGVGVPPQPATEPPRGKWVAVPGQWANGTWIPSHQVWVAQ